MMHLHHIAMLLGAATPMPTHAGMLPQDDGTAAVAQDATAAVQAVLERYRTEYDAWRAKMRAATPEERASIPPVAVDGFVSELVAIAERAKGSEAAAKAWMAVVQLAPRGKDPAVIGVAVDAILRDHLASPETASLAGYLSRGLEPAQAQVQLRRVVAGTPKGRMQAGALLELANALAADERTVAGSANEKELEEVVARIQVDCAELQDQAGRAFPDIAAGVLFARQRLQVGLEVPEIEAADTQGVVFKLSDYRGKVVLLDFWGNW